MTLRAIIPLNKRTSSARSGHFNPLVDRLQNPFAPSERHPALDCFNASTQRSQIVGWSG
jgi:hypothetical protein